ncbi:MAG TPA: ketoacyl-ACP synthase III, partial [Bdellovibrio sp.]|nr:ketoacyl-ACP synthase III [Bdellovibrio sp.]
MKRAVIVGTGMYAPERVISNQYFDDLYKKDIGTFLVENRNIKERHWMREDQRTSDLIIPAAEEALKNAGITAKDLDLIVVSTDTPDYLSPSTASVVAYRLGASRAGTFDINTACAGFVVGCDLASKYITSDSKYQNILVVGAYGMSKYLNMDDYKISSLFADGAGAVVIQPSRDSSGFIDSQMYTDGQYHDYMGIYAGGTALPLSHSVIENRQHLLAFPKRIPPETNGLHWPRLTHTLLDRLQKRPEEIRHF